MEVRPITHRAPHTEHRYRFMVPPDGYMLHLRHTPSGILLTLTATILKKAHRDHPSIYRTAALIVASYRLAMAGLHIAIDDRFITREWRRLFRRRSLANRVGHAEDIKQVERTRTRSLTDHHIHVASQNRAASPTSFDDEVERAPFHSPKKDRCFSTIDLCAMAWH